MVSKKDWKGKNANLKQIFSGRVFITREFTSVKYKMESF